MDGMSPGEIWTIVAWVAAAVVLLGQAVEKISKAIKAAKAPNDHQNARLDALEEWRKDVDRKLHNDKAELTAIQDGLRAIYQGQLALLDHGLEGNNVTQMEAAKKVLQQHLISARGKEE